MDEALVDKADNKYHTGLTYVDFSRVNTLYGFFIEPSFSLERLAKINWSPSLNGHKDELHNLKNQADKNWCKYVIIQSENLCLLHERQTNVFNESSILLIITIIHSHRTKMVSHHFVRKHERPSYKTEGFVLLCPDVLFFQPLTPLHRIYQSIVN